MEIKYRILEKDESTHALVVRFTTAELNDDALTANEEELRDVEINGVMVPRWFPKLREDGSPWRCRADMRIELPIPAPIDEELRLFILERAPIGWLEREERVRRGEQGNTALSHVSVGESYSCDVETLKNDLKVRAILAAEAAREAANTANTNNITI